MKKRGNRDEMVIATKYTTNFRAGPSAGPNTIMANFSGNGSKSLHTSVEASLKKLQTDYIDLVKQTHTLAGGKHTLTLVSALRPLVGLLLQHS
jgi:aryl-alcohol dehydrogenase-like predicted oxidoreductase